MKKVNNKKLMKMFKRWRDLKDGEQYGSIVKPVVAEIENGNTELRDSVKAMLWDIETEENRRISALHTLSDVDTPECRALVKEFLHKVMADDTEDPGLHLAAIWTVEGMPWDERDEFVSLIEGMTFYDDHRGKVAFEFLEERDEAQEEEKILSETQKGECKAQSLAGV